MKRLLTLEGLIETISVGSGRLSSDHWNKVRLGLASGSVNGYEDIPSKFSSRVEGIGL